MPTTHLAALFALLMAVVSVEGENKNRTCCIIDPRAKLAPGSWYDIQCTYTQTKIEYPFGCFLPIGIQAHPASVLILHLRGIRSTSSVVTSYDTEIMHRKYTAVEGDKAMQMSNELFHPVISGCRCW